jgi:hypothetical protein
MLDTDIGRLQAKHPLWRIGSVWATAGSGPDKRGLTATREGIQVHAWTEAALSESIAHEERTNGWPSDRPA